MKATDYMQGESYSPETRDPALESWWESFQASFAGDPDYDPDVYLSDYLIHSPNGDDVGEYVMKSLFNPKIVGNALVFTGYEEYGNRPGVRTYGWFFNRMVLSSGRYFPN